MFRRRVQDYWLPTPFASFPFTSPPVRHRVPPHSVSAIELAPLLSCGVLDMSHGDNWYVMWGFLMYHVKILMSCGDTWYVMWGFLIYHVGILMSCWDTWYVMWDSWYVMWGYLKCHVRVIDVSCGDTWHVRWGFLICHVGILDMSRGDTWYMWCGDI